MNSTAPVSLEETQAALGMSDVPDMAVAEPVEELTTTLSSDAVSGLSDATMSVSDLPTVTPTLPKTTLSDTPIKKVTAVTPLTEEVSAKLTALEGKLEQGFADLKARLDSMKPAIQTTAATVAATAAAEETTTVPIEEQVFVTGGSLTGGGRRRSKRRGTVRRPRRRAGSAARKTRSRK